MDLQSQRALIVVLVVGSIIVAVGTLTLYVVFRMFGEKKAGSTTHRTIIAVLITFIFLCCLGLFALSYSGQ